MIYQHLHMLNIHKCYFCLHRTSTFFSFLDLFDGLALGDLAFFCDLAFDDLDFGDLDFGDLDFGDLAFGDLALGDLAFGDFLAFDDLAFDDLPFGDLTFGDLAFDDIEVSTGIVLSLSSTKKGNIFINQKKLF
jgi:hypothetical protein